MKLFELIMNLWVQCYELSVQGTDIVDFCQTNLSKVHLHWDSFALLVFKKARLDGSKNKYITKWQATYSIKIQKELQWCCTTKLFWGGRNEY